MYFYLLRTSKERGKSDYEVKEGKTIKRQLR